MSVGLEVLFGLIILVGVCGVVVPLLPGAIMVAVTVIVWAAVASGSVDAGGPSPWIFATIAALIVAATWLLKYLLAGKTAKAGGVPNFSIISGGLVGIIGFFVIPVIGLVIGFVAGVFLAELIRTSMPRQAFDGAIVATKAAAVSVLVELFGALLAATAWLVGALMI